MAERRMFSRSVVESARFLKMPVSSQNLYFHLVMNADDDGIARSGYRRGCAGCIHQDAIDIYRHRHSPMGYLSSHGGTLRIIRKGNEGHGRQCPCG